MTADLLQFLCAVIGVAFLIFLAMDIAAGCNKDRK